MSPAFTGIGPLSTECNDAIRLQRLQHCAADGLFQYALPKEYGGLDNGFAELVARHQALGEISRDPGLMLAINAHLWGSVFPLLRHGTEIQKKQWLPQLVSGKMIGGHAITEAQSGSDLSQLQTRAESTPLGYLINGKKCYITNAPIADCLIVYAVLKDHGITAFVICMNDAGCHIKSDATVDSCRGAAMGEVVLEDCHLEKTRRVGKPGAGAMLIQQALEQERAFIFAGIAGVMDWQLQKVITFSRERRSGNGHLGRHQAISHRIADMKLRLDTLRLWLKECARLCDHGQRITLAAAQTKLYASEAFLQSSLDAVHIMGAAGLETKNNLATLVLDAMGGRLLSGSSEIQKNIIAGLLGTGEGYRGGMGQSRPQSLA